MTIEELAHLSIEKLESLSDKELTKILEQYFNVTRPEKIVRKQKGSESKPVFSQQQQKALSVLSELGIDTSGAFKKQRKK
jgi:hypothetical protein